MFWFGIILFCSSAESHRNVPRKVRIVSVPSNCLSTCLQSCILRIYRIWSHIKRIKWVRRLPTLFCIDSTYGHWQYYAILGGKMKFNPVTTVEKLESLPDMTPCAPSSWCQKGKCVQSPKSEKMTNFLQRVAKPVHGGWSADNCHQPRCLVNKFRNPRIYVFCNHTYLDNSSIKPTWLIVDNFINFCIYLWMLNPIGKSNNET